MSVKVSCAESCFSASRPFTPPSSSWSRAAFPNNRKNKLVRVTSQGEQLLCQVTDPVFAMEERAFLRLSPHQRQALLDLDEALLDALRQESTLILNPPKTP